MRKYEIAANLMFHWPLLVGLGMLLVVVYPLNIAVIALLYLCGIADLVYSKFPLYRRGILFSFGPHRIPAQRRDAYFRAYQRLSLGAALNLLAIVHYSVPVTMH